MPVSVRKMSDTVIGQYTKIEDKFVDAYLTKNGEMMEGKEPIKLRPRTVGSVIVGILGVLMLGIGMCLTMVFGKMILGIVIGLIEIVVLLMLIPLTKKILMLK